MLGGGSAEFVRFVVVACCTDADVTTGTVSSCDV